MASNKEYLTFILDQLSELEEISYRPMMGEYILYYRGKIIGGIYDNRLLLKPVKVVMDQLGQTKLERPYEGAKEMILIEDIEDKSCLIRLIKELYEVLPASKVKKKACLPFEKVALVIKGSKQKSSFLSALVCIFMPTLSGSYICTILLVSLFLLKI